MEEEKKVIKQMKQNAKKDEEKVKNTLAVKVEEVNLQREKNELKRLEQRENYLKIKKEHQDKMLSLQAKHFRISAKNKIQNIQFENQK